MDTWEEHAIQRPHLPQRVTVYEVGPRDGLQNEAELLSVDVKVGFIDRLTASETFNRHNIHAGVDESIERFRPVVARAKEEGIRVRAYVSTAFGCPYEGVISPEAVREVVHKLLDLPVDEISLGDTIGVATPSGVYDVVETLYESGVTRGVLALHFHDTRGTALANVYAGLQCGITTFDASAGGLGGCPYAPGAAGNLATEDLLYMLEGLGVETGVALPKVVEASRYLAEAIGHRPPGRYLAAVWAPE